MTDVWLAMPSANLRLAAATLPVWKGRGYKIALMVDTIEYARSVLYTVDLLALSTTYRGYPWAVNWLCRELPDVAEAPIVVAAGDDMLPDNRPADEIAAEFLEHFPDTMGVMQPTGDSFMLDDQGRPAAARICGSPWMGRAFRERIHGGKGPFWPEFYHFYCDEALYEVAVKFNLLWQRPDLTHHHQHWTRTNRRRPEHIRRARSLWDQDKDILARWRSKGYPGADPLPEPDHTTAP